MVQWYATRKGGGADVRGGRADAASWCGVVGAAWCNGMRRGGAAARMCAEEGLMMRGRGVDGAAWCNGMRRGRADEAWSWCGWRVWLVR